MMPTEWPVAPNFTVEIGCVVLFERTGVVGNEWRGLNPTTPHKEAGMRVDPAPLGTRPMCPIPAAIAPAVPPELPLVRDSNHEDFECAH